MLVINKEKSHIAHSDEGIKFLGVEIKSRYTQIQSKKLATFKDNVRDLTRRNGGKPLLKVIKELNPLLRGFSQYFRIANANKQFKALAGWIRRRLRSIQLRLWKKPARLHRRLKQHGYKPPFKYINMRVWNSSKSPLASYAMPNQWFTELGLFNLETVMVGKVFTYEYK
ncbi:group II intron maturase-specific domain-containing protein [Aliivibrio wodanis]